MKPNREMLALMICWDAPVFQYISSALKRIGIYSISVEENGFTKGALEALADTPVTMVIVDEAFLSKAPFQMVEELFPGATIIKVTTERAERTCAVEKRELAMRMRFPGAAVS